MSYKEVVSVPCPGSRDNLVPLTNYLTTHFGLENLYNSGSCTLYVGGIDASGQPVDPGSNLELGPGESADSYHAPPGAEVIVVGCSKECSGYGELTYSAAIA